MATPESLYITSATKVGEIDRALEIWKKIQPANPQEREYINQNLEKLNVFVYL